MRRGGLLLLLGVVIAAAAALLFFFFFQTPPAPETTALPQEPTPVPLRKVVAARVDIPANTVLTDTETLLTLRDIPEPEYNAAPDQYFTSVGELTTKVTLRALNATEIIRARDLTDAGLSFQVPPPDTIDAPRNKVFPLEVGNLTGVADQIRPGDSVDLVMTYEIRRLIIRPSLTTDPETGQLVVTPIEETLVDRVTKTMVQNVQVLRVLKPAIPQDTGTPTPGGAQGEPAPPPSSTQQQGDTYVPGAQWILLLAMTDQEAEIVKFTLDQQDPKPQITLVLRGRDDGDIEETTGITLRLLTSRYGLPLPEPLQPLALAPEEITPGPARPTPTSFPQP
ncbi:SAF domain-containing protein [Roseiflexus sp.]|uniref:SAF domain-containing protein n=1 Tax=Roseiflexus sp. TaxID=2562120 RepID=UPI0021DE8B08|nr:SAF domain-containing protein [Roseiflexus sp.]GIW00664.1 MAG: pilus assembly protein CpaB [Roseiflexus sp.]